MSPEQARGKVVDRRADIWAFGVVVYEMLAGRRPFDGEDVSTTVAAVIQSEPRWDAIPQSMLRLLKRCLTKDPRRRLRDVGDVWELLDVETPVTRSRTGTAGWIVAALATIAAAVALWAPWRGAERPADRPLVKLEIDLGADVTLPPLVIPTPSSLAISPDGTRLAYLAGLALGHWQSLDEIEALPKTLERFEPKLDAATREAALTEWRGAVARCLFDAGQAGVSR